jgi:hypothetical protein
VWGQEWELFAKDKTLQLEGTNSRDWMNTVNNNMLFFI